MFFQKTSLCVFNLSRHWIISYHIFFPGEFKRTRITIENSEENKLKKQASQKIPKNSITDNEEKLNAIREILISEALKTKANVKASSWIDTDGSLHENLYVLSEGYSTKHNSLRNNISEEDFNINQLKPHKKSKYCRFSNPSYARVAELIVGVGRSSLELPFNDLETIRKKAEKTYKVGLTTHQNWVFVQQKPLYKTSYERFLSDSSLNKPQYRIEVQVQPIEKFSFQKKRNHVEVKLLLKITGLG